MSMDFTHCTLICKCVSELTTYFIVVCDYGIVNLDKLTIVRQTVIAYTIIKH